MSPLGLALAVSILYFLGAHLGLALLTQPDGVAVGWEVMSALRPSTLAPRWVPHIAAVLDDLKPEAVPFGLVQPIVALGRTWGRGDGGTDEGKTWHD
jgi:hypothetical protein